MDKRVEANLRVKKQITDAMFELMHEKSFSDITITELIKRAGVARASYYRNYSSKEDVLETLMDDVLEYYRAGIIEDGPFLSYGNILRSFQFFQTFSRYVIDLYQSGFAYTLMEKLNQFHESIVGIMPANSIKRYEIYAYMGALVNIGIRWLQDGQKETPEEMAAFLLQDIVYGRQSDCSG